MGRVDFKGGVYPHDYNNPRELVSTENQVTVRATVNGEPRVFAAGTTLLEVVEGLQLAPERVAIEFNRLIVKRGLWETTEIREGSEIEIVMFVGGG